MKPKSIPNIDDSWTLFIDRDGVINERNFEGYITTPDKFKFLPGVFEGLKRIHDKVGRVILVTNQQGVGKGIMTECNLNELHSYMVEKLEKSGIHFDGIFAATNIRGVRNDRRKPRPNMAFEARRQFEDIDFKKSIMIGDTDGDIRFGTNLGMITVLISSEEKVNEQPDFIVNDLEELANDWNL